MYSLSVHILSRIISLDFTGLGAQFPILISYFAVACVEKLQVHRRNEKVLNWLSISCHLLSHFSFDLYIKKKKNETLIEKQQGLFL